MYQRMVSKLALPYQVSWIIVAGLLFLIFLLLAVLGSASMSYSFLAIFPAFIIAFVPIVITWASKKLSQFEQVLHHVIDQPEAEISLWYRNELKEILSVTRMCMYGAMFAAIFVPCVGAATGWWWQFPFSWFNSSACEVFLTFMLTVAMFMVGTALHVLIYTAILVFRLSRLDLRITIYQDPETSIKAVGRLYVKFALMAAIADVAFILAFILSPLALTPLIAFWLIAISLLVIVYFLAPLLLVRNRISALKHEKISQFSARLEEAFREVTTDPTSESVEQLAVLLEIKEHLLRLNEWPFDSGAAISLVTATIIPIIAILIEAKGIIQDIF